MMSLFKTISIHYTLPDYGGGAVIPSRSAPICR